MKWQSGVGYVCSHVKAQLDWMSRMVHSCSWQLQQTVVGSSAGLLARMLPVSLQNGSLRLVVFLHGISRLSKVNVLANKIKATLPFVT